MSYHKRLYSDLERELYSRTIGDLKGLLKEKEIKVSGRKGELVKRILDAESTNLTTFIELTAELNSLKCFNSIEHFLNYGKLLMDKDKNTWDINFAVTLAKRVISTSFSNPFDIDPKIISFMGELGKFSNLVRCSAKTEKLIWNESNHLFFQTLTNKGYDHWSVSDIDAIVEKLGNVCQVNCNSNTNSLAAYLLFQEELLKLYTINPNVKYRLDPILVVIDLQSTTAAAVQQAVNGLPQNVIPVDGDVPLPQKDNATEAPFAWSFKQQTHALWFCGYLKGKIPAIRIMVYQTAGAVAHY